MKLWHVAFASALFLAPAGADEDQEKPDFAPWAEAGKGMEAQEGFWNFLTDKKKTKFWVEIPSGQIGKEFLVATSISGGTPMAGWQWNDWLLVWELHEKRLVLLERNVGVQSENGTLKEAIDRTYTDRVLATYPVRAKGPKGGYVLDGEQLFAGGATLFFGSIGRSKDASLAKFDGSKNFPENSEISVTLPSADDGKLIQLHYSIRNLPKTSYKPREADDRVGYFLTVLKDFSDKNKDLNRAKRYVNRWHLEKRDPNLALSPPKEPIRFYIERTVPVRLRRYVVEGILEWNKAFEKIGFYQAIVVDQQTETEHADKDPEDVRYNFFRWIVSDRPFAMGPSRVDPRTGQILDADIIFDDSYVRYTLQEYKHYLKQVPATMIDPRDARVLESHPLSRLGIVPAEDEFVGSLPEDAPRPFADPHSRRAFCSVGHGAQHQLGTTGLWFAVGGEGTGEEFPEEVIGQFLKDTVMHEVGHTLGLRHNFKASIYRGIDEINSEEKPGDIAGSVMDYNPLIVAPEGRPQGNYAMTTIGPYDMWAIAYGYTTDEKQLPEIVKRVAEDGLDYATDEDTWSYDPYINRWDIGADPLDYAKERVALMKRLRPTLEDRVVKSGEGYQQLRRAVDMQFFEGRWAGSLAVRHVGGEHVHRDHRDDPGARPPLLPVDANKQREALRFVCDEFLSGRYYDFRPELLQKLAPDFWGEDWMSLFFYGHGYPFLDNVLATQVTLLYGLTSPSRLSRVLGTRHKVTQGQSVLAPSEIFDAVTGAVFGGLMEAVRGRDGDAPALSEMRRNLQREYVTHLVWILLEGHGYYPASIQTLVRHYVKEIGRSAREALAAGGDGLDTATRAHLEECATRLERALEASYTLR